MPFKQARAGSGAPAERMHCNEQVASEIVTSLFDAQWNRVIRNEATQKAIERAISIGWGGRDRTSEWRNQNPLNTIIKSMALLNFLLPFTH
jgi:hypothetical protein